MASREVRRVHELLIRTVHSYNWSRVPEIRKIGLRRFGKWKKKDMEQKRRIHGCNNTNINVS